MDEEPDYRSERMDSYEGYGLARGRWFAYRETYPEDVQQAAGGAPTSPWHIFPPEAREQVAKQAKDRAELIGFWVTWHQAGGFDNMEAMGWHRSTIFRKVRKFRKMFGEHPDRYRFPWIELDLKQVWKEQLYYDLGLTPDAGHQSQP